MQKEQHRLLLLRDSTSIYLKTNAPTLADVWFLWFPWSSGVGSVGYDLRVVVSGRGARLVLLHLLLVVQAIV